MSNDNSEMFCARDSQIILYFFAIFLAFSNFIILFPGVYMSDSLGSLSQASSNVYNDWFPPFFAYLMHITIPVFREGGMLFIQQFLYWLGLAYFIGQFKLKYSFLYLFLGFFPPVFNYILIIVRDSFFIISIIFIIGLTLSYKKKANFIKIIFIFLFLILLESSRENGFIISLFLVFIIFSYLFPDTRKKFIKFGALSILCILLGVSSKLLINKLLNVQARSQLTIVVLWEIGSIAKFANDKPDLPPYLNFNPHFEENKIWLDYINLYTCTDIWSKLCWDKSNPLPFNWDQANANRLLLLKDFFKYIFNNPLAFLKHRIFLIKQIFGFGQRWCIAPHSWSDPDKQTGNLQISRLGKFYYKKIMQLSELMIDLYIYQSGTYFFLSIPFLFFYLIKWRKLSKSPYFILAFGLLLTSYANDLCLFIMAPATDSRYISPSILLFLLSSCFLPFLFFPKTENHAKA